VIVTIGKAWLISATPRRNPVDQLAEPPNRMLRSLFLLPVNVIAKLGMETFDVKTKHAVHAQLAQFSRISSSEGRFFLFGEIVFPHYGFEIR
jgi:hypothetical protein